MTKTAFEQIKAGLDEAAIVAPYLAEIERLTRERDGQKETAEYLLKLEQEWINYNNQLAEDWKKEHARADAAERKVEKLREALKKLLARDERNTCQHDETHRGGVLWDICDRCGAKWADDEGGKPEWEDPPEWVEARAALDETEKGDD